MNDRIINTLIALLLGIAVSSAIWAVGSQARKRVEIAKNTTLSVKVDMLTKANVAASDDLKKTTNTLAETTAQLQQTRRQLGEEILAAKTLNVRVHALQQELDKTVENYTQTIEQLHQKISQLKTANIDLGEELSRLRATCRDLEGEKRKLEEEITTLRKKADAPGTPPVSATKPGERKSTVAASSQKKHNLSW